MNIHAVSHSIPHRGPGASRARARWQPYASTVVLSNLPKSSPSVYLHTPASSVASSSPPTIRVLPIPESERLKSLPQQIPPANPLREAQKAKYAAKLVDQAVKSLCDTWHPDDIPSVFIECGSESLCAQPEPPTPHAETPAPHPMMTAGFSKLFGSRNTQLPSPISPTSRPSPSPPADGRKSYSQAPEGSGGSNLIPIKGFVHEVLRRSRTSTGVLQTALCYLEAVRCKVPELLRKEKARPTSEYSAEPEAEPRIVVGSSEQLNPPDVTLPDAFSETAGPTLDTIRVDDAHLASAGADIDMPSQSGASGPRYTEQAPLPPLPSLPSPLCCPRRTFLACLILASKFMQDRSYSNRAWAKLAGLPPREIGRCERALGEALEWRLWVGKLPSTPTSSTVSGMCAGRAFTRARSEGDLLVSTSSPSCTSYSTAAWAAATAGVATPCATSSHMRTTIPTPLPTPRTTRTIRRSATVPSVGSDGFTASADPFFPSTGRTSGTAYYDTRSAPGTGFETAFAMDVEPLLEVSPSLSTPTLSYSPMSSASSSSDGSEERTIQMSAFMDLPTPSCSATGPFGGPWVATSFSYPPADPANPYCTSAHVNINSYYTTSNVYSEGGVGENVDGAAGPTLAAIGVAGTKMVPMTLPSFAEAFPGQCPGMTGYGTR